MFAGRIEASFVPLPNPQQLLQYRELLPDIAATFVSWHEEEQKHRRELEKATQADQSFAIRGQVRAMQLGVAVAGLVSIGTLTVSAVLLVTGHYTGAGVAAAATAVALAGSGLTRVLRERLRKPRAQDESDA